MSLCGITLIVLIVLRIWKRPVFWRQNEVWRRVWLIMAVAAVLGILVGIGGRASPVLLDGNRLKRNDAGQGSYEEELWLTVEGLVESRSYPVSVPEYKMTAQEEQECLENALEELMQELPGENSSLNEVRECVKIRDSYEGGLVEAEWSFDNYDVMDFEGNVIAQQIPDSGILVCASVTLSCGGSERCEEICFHVFPRELSEPEQALAELQKGLKDQEGEQGRQFLELPGKVQGHAVSWREKKTYQPVQILLLGAVFAVLIPLAERSRKKEAQKIRLQKMVMEYPDVVSKLAILISAGMTLQGAWKKIAYLYEKKRKDNICCEKPVYEEMLIACHEMESGMGEERVYIRFGERCKDAGYRKLANILSQNLRKGTRDIVELLEREAEQSFERRKQEAKRYGEEAGTKLLFPMMLMLGMIMVILIVPAIISFQV